MLSTRKKQRERTASSRIQKLLRHAKTRNKTFGRLNFDDARRLQKFYRKTRSDLTGITAALKKNEEHLGRIENALQQHDKRRADLLAQEKKWLKAVETQGSLEAKRALLRTQFRIKDLERERRDYELTQQNLSVWILDLDQAQNLLEAIHGSCRRNLDRLGVVTEDRETSILKTRVCDAAGKCLGCRASKAKCSCLGNGNHHTLDNITVLYKGDPPAREDVYAAALKHLVERQQELQTDLARERDSYSRYHSSDDHWRQEYMETNRNLEHERKRLKVAQTRYSEFTASARKHADSCLEKMGDMKAGDACGAVLLHDLVAVCRAVQQYADSMARDSSSDQMGVRVYGVVADWYTDTYRHSKEPFRSLRRDALLVKLTGDSQ